MKILIPFILLIFLVIISGCIQNQQSSNDLPSDFTINIANDATSSGATRTHTTTLTFKNNQLVEGYQERFISNSYRQTTYSCTINETSWWVDEQGRQCGYSDFIYLSSGAEKQDLQERINEGEFKKKDSESVGRFIPTYEILP